MPRLSRFFEMWRFSPPGAPSFALFAKGGILRASPAWDFSLNSRAFVPKLHQRSPAPTLFANCAKRMGHPAMQFIKGGFSFRLKSRFSVWQASFTNHRIHDLEDYASHREYIWLNPVRARMVERADAYPHSSATGRFDLDPVPQGLKPRIQVA